MSTTPIWDELAERYAQITGPVDESDDVETRDEK